jgi:hypothetical protein
MFARTVERPLKANNIKDLPSRPAIWLTEKDSIRTSS